MRQYLSLVADIGGTNTRLAYAQGADVDKTSMQKFTNAQFSNLQEVIAHYMSLHPAPDVIDACCVAIAGPVNDGKGTLTNLPWTIDEAALKAATGCSYAAVLNDLQAQGYAVNVIESSCVEPLTQQQKTPKGNQLIVGVGTGFNAVLIAQTPQGDLIVPQSEAGHSDLPVKTPDDLTLAASLAQLHGSCAIEDVLSGRGLTYLYAHLKNCPLTSPPKTAAQIMESCSANTDPIAVQAVVQFCRFLGMSCGNLALVHLPYGGIYFVGGVMRAIWPYLKESAFLTGFSDKGRFSGLMKEFPFFMVDDDFAALTGGAYFLTSALNYESTHG